MQAIAEEGSLAALRFDPDTGLLPAIVQSDFDGTVLMIGWMNREALHLTLRNGRVTFWSRSRGKLWEKGATSGNWMELVSATADCDRDALLVKVRPHGPVCHTGSVACFADVEEDDGVRPGLASALTRLEARVRERDENRTEESYTAALLDAGTARIAQKVGEEAIETALAAVGDPSRLAAESADLLYHLVVLWRAARITPGDVAGELVRREQLRG